jgi:two-component system cell cycle sensor histidine kinase/response regulator CckA
VAEHLFEPFFTTKDKRRGAGLGLSTVYGILQQAGAHIRLDHRPGEGNRVSPLFPARGRGAGPAATDPQSDDAFFRGNERVLLAEDDRAVRVMAARVLRQGGYRVTEAANGEEALRLTEDPGFGVDLLITDVVMHGLSGPDLAKKITEKRPGVKVLYISGYMEEDARTSVLKDAGAAFLPKPFRPRDLLQKARDHPRRRPPRGRGGGMKVLVVDDDKVGAGFRRARAWPRPATRSPRSIPATRPWPACPRASRSS